LTQRSLAQRMIRRDLFIATVLGATVLIGVSGWAATVPLSGAVIASGTVVVHSNLKKVQHLTGGVVSEILVHNGSKVSAGDVLIRLDPTQSETNLAIVTRHLDELRAREARLIAERDGRERLTFDGSFRTRLNDPDTAKVVGGELTLYRARLMSRNGKRAQLNERSTQLLEEIRGLQAQVSGKDREAEIINAELTAVRQLRLLGLTEQSRVNSLERDAARLASERGVLVSAIAQTRGKIAETELQILQIDEDLQQEVAKELRETSATMGELIERKIAAEDQLARIEIKAPQSGIVHELAIHGREAIIAAGETIMQIVPDTDTLEVEARIAPQDIDQIAPGQSVELRFSAFNQQTTPAVPGFLKSIGADLTRELQTGLSYYAVRISVAPESVDLLQNLRLVPGMPVEVFLKTQDRTMLSYLAKPLADQFQRSFRDP
jgi:HlyD family secretion protein